MRAILESRLDFYKEVSIDEDEDAQLQEVFRRTLDNPDNSDVKTLYKDVNALSDAAISLMNKKARLGWTSYGHTAAAVPLFAIGKGAERFTGWHDITEIAPTILDVLRIGK